MVIATSFVIPAVLMISYLFLVLFYADVAMGERGFTLGGLIFCFSFAVLAYGADLIQPGLGFIAQVLSAISFIVGLSSAVGTGGRHLWIKASALSAVWLGSWWVLSLPPFGGSGL